MQPQSYPTAQPTKLTTSDHTSNATGKFPNPYLNVATVNSVVRKPKSSPQIRTTTSEFLPLLSPHTRVCGKGEAPDKINSILNPDRILIEHNSLRKNAQIHTHTPNPRYKKLTAPLCEIYSLEMTGQGGGRGAARDLTIDPDFIMREANSPPQGTGTKRSGGNKTTSAEKKNKPAPKEALPKQFWLGFEMMEKLAIEEEVPIHATPTTLHGLARSGFSEKEAKEFLKSVVSYPHVGQSCYPVSHPDGVPGQHYNITQLPFEIETDPDSGLSMDYQVAIYFKKPSRPYMHEEILAATQARLKEMRIALGNKIAEPIAILCRNGSTRHWAGTIKLHLKHPAVDGMNLLKGNRPFIITLEEVMTVGKVCKSYNTIAKNNLLSVKISSPSLGNCHVR